MITIQEIIKQTNDYRYEQDLPALTPNSALMKAAQSRAEDMAKSGLFSHSTSTDPKVGLAFPTYMKQAGYQYGYGGENLAEGTLNATNTMSKWRASPTHNQNLVNSHYTDIGIAIVPGVYKGKKTEFVVYFFGSPQATQPTKKTPTKPIVKAVAKSVTKPIVKPAPAAPAKTYPYYPMTLQNANSTIVKK